MKKLTYSVLEVSKILGISKTTAYCYCNNGTIPSFRIGKRIVIPVKQFEEWMEQEVGAY